MATYTKIQSYWRQKMTKKDGVDVNECDFFIKNRDKYLCRCTKINSFGDIVNPKNAENSNCLDNYNCYYKQLARKTQIINEIEEVIKPYQEPIELDALSLVGAIKSILERKTQECEEIKEELKP